jgi:hypothetical protein
MVEGVDCCLEEGEEAVLEEDRVEDRREEEGEDLSC